MCGDLNKTNPKNVVLLACVNSIAGHAMFSFMDGFPSYNQIKMVTEHREKTYFFTLGEIML